MENKIFFITGNEFKFKLAKSKLNLNPNIFQLEQKKLEIHEIQADSIEEVAKHSVKEATNKLNAPCIKNDSGLIIFSLKGFPGPYTRFIEDTITEKGVLKLLEGIEERKAQFIEVLAFCKPGEEPVAFKCVTKGIIGIDLKGEYGWSFDKIFIPLGNDKTLAEFPDDERIKLWDSSGYEELSKHINGN